MISFQFDQLMTTKLGKKSFATELFVASQQNDYFASSWYRAQVIFVQHKLSNVF